VRLGIGLNEGYKPIAGVMHHSTNTFLASVLAMSVIVLEDNDRLLLALSRMFDIARMKVAVVAVISANRAYPLLFGQ
jgi:hypothetical protein